MKKLFTLIALTCGIIPTLHGMDTNLPADVQKQYDNLTVLIQNADIETFKPAFDALTLSAENIAVLHQTVAETKAAVTNELEAMGDKTKNWSKTVKGSLASVGGLWAGISIPSLMYLVYKGETEIPGFFPLCIGSIPNIIPTLLIFTATGRLEEKKRVIATIPGSLLNLGIAYKALTYGTKTLKVGLNYKKHLQNMLTHLDAIDTHIAQPKA